MKKNYIKPEMKVYEIETPKLLAASDPETFSLQGSTADNNDEMWEYRISFCFNNSWRLQAALKCHLQPS